MMFACCGSRDTRDCKYFSYLEKKPVHVIYDVPNELADEEVLVEVKYAGITARDVKRFDNFEAIGQIFSGCIKKIGKTATRFLKGQNVYGWIDSTTTGTVSEYLVVPQTNIAKVPDGVSLNVASSLPFVGYLIHQAFNDAKEKQKIYFQGPEGLLKNIFYGFVTENKLVLGMNLLH